MNNLNLLTPTIGIILMTFVKTKCKEKTRNWKEQQTHKKAKRNSGHRPRVVKQGLWLESIEA